MDPAVAALQSAINRFAAVDGFARVAVDGFWGAKTKQGVYDALAFVGQGKCYRSVCIDEDMARSAAGIMAQWDQSMNAARGLAEFLTGAANELDLPHVAAPLPSPAPAPAPGPIVPTAPAFQMSLVERFRFLPLWQQIAISALGAIGLIFLVSRIKRA